MGGIVLAFIFIFVGFLEVSVLLPPEWFLIAVIPGQPSLGTELLLKLTHCFLLIGRTHCFRLTELANPAPAGMGVEFATVLALEQLKEVELQR